LDDASSYRSFVLSTQPTRYALPNKPIPPWIIRGSPGHDMIHDLKTAVLREPTKDAIEAAHPRDVNGDFIDPNTGQIIPAAGPFHYGHRPGFEYWRNRDMAQANGWTREQFIEFENDPSHYWIEDPYNNMSHQYEMP
ncbi:MAG TPA: HNH/ENDO VII family nuclease, partial [Candidatus Limnocylindrales bacterium]|nr:HNH/ENDO VII family nuclease [Candidatus Limnocylindrales bacterium]